MERGRHDRRKIKAAKPSFSSLATKPIQNKERCAAFFTVRSGRPRSLRAFINIPRP
jgi:hypothetical protein